MPSVLYFVILCLILCRCSCWDKFLFEFPPKSRRAVTSDEKNLHGSIVSGFYTKVYLGTPPQKVNAIVDTGSSNFAVAGYREPSVLGTYDKSISATSHDLQYDDLHVQYTEGSWTGSLVKDVMSIPSAGLKVPVMLPIAVISSSEDFFTNGSNWKAIMGLAYNGLVQPTALHIPSVFANIVSEANVSDRFSMQLCSYHEKDDVDGVFAIGPMEPSLYTGQLHWTLITRKLFYEVVIVSMLVGNVYLPVDCKELNKERSIIDSGTTNLRFPKTVFDLVVKEIKNGVSQHGFSDGFFHQKEIFCSPKDHSLFEWFPSITIFLPSVGGSKTFALVIYPESYLQYVANGSSSSTVCYNFAIFPSETGTVLGTVVMQQYYVVFNRERDTIGFARSKCTWIAAYVLMGFLGVSLVLVCVMYISQRCRRQKYGWCSPAPNAHADTSELLRN